MSNTLLFYLGFIILASAILVLVSANRKKKSLGLPSGKIIYSDPGILGRG
jgi:hypothetical protein